MRLYARHFLSENILNALVICGLCFLLGPLQSAECALAQDQPAAAGESQSDRESQPKPGSTEKHGTASRVRLGNAKVETLSHASVGDTSMKARKKAIFDANRSCFFMES